MKRTGPTNFQLQNLLVLLEKKSLESKLWRRVADDLKKPTRQRRIVNLYKLNENAREGEIMLVPGKVLSVGEVEKKVEVAALNFSAEAKKKILEAKGKVWSIPELLQHNPEGKKVRIIG